MRHRSVALLHDVRGMPLDVGSEQASIAEPEHGGRFANTLEPLRHGTQTGNNAAGMTWCSRDEQRTASSQRAAQHRRRGGGNND